MKHFITILIFVILLILLGETIGSNQSTFSLQSYKAGFALPSFSVPQLFDPEKSLTENDLKGQVCLLNFWASWCNACQRELKTLILINRKYQIPIFGITFKDDAEKSKAFLSKIGNPYGVVGTDATGSTANDFEIFGIPITYIIDKHSLIRYRFLGTLTIQSWKTQIQPLIDNLEQEP